MKIKKFEGKTEQEVMQRVKEELGLSAIVLSIKRKPYRGLMAFFKSPLIVVTAAYEEKTSAEKLLDARLNADKKAVQEKAQAFLLSQARQKTVNSAIIADVGPEEGMNPAEQMYKEVRLADQQQRIASLENKLSATEELLAKAISQLTVTEQIARHTGARKYDNNVIQLFYDSLVEQGVKPEIADKLLEHADAIDEREKVDMSLLIKIIYNTVMDIIGEPSLINIDPDMEDIQVVAFMGATGVGKTTTIAKLSSVLTLEHNVRVGLITADTYRIAAVEQLKTYGDILGLDVQVVYGNEDITWNLELLKPVNDVILIDTAGRSHRNNENLSDLKSLLDMVPDCKKYLVLSVTTKYEDLLHIIEMYNEITDYGIIFTKLDETDTWGSIINVCYLTGKKASYVTFGQNVPDDIEIIQPEKITKALLGLGKEAADRKPGKVKGGLRA